MDAGGIISGSRPVGCQSRPGADLSGLP